MSCIEYVNQICEHIIMRIFLPQIAQITQIKKYDPVFCDKENHQHGYHFQNLIIFAPHSKIGPVA